jgi:hypothetical protein
VADPTPTPTPDPTPAPPWYGKFDSETQGHIQNRGWDKLTAPAAAVEALKAFRNAESKLGIPADRVLKIPEPSDAAGWADIHAKLGAPATPDLYDFTTVKAPDGKDPDPAFIDLMRSTAATLHLPKDAAPGLASVLLKYNADQAAVASVKEQAANALAQDALKASWGANFDTNKFVADRAAALLGVAPEAFEALAKSSSYGVVMEGLRKIGVAMGEAVLVGNAGAGGGNRPATREQAQARLADLKSDTGWLKRWFDGGAAEKAEFEALTRTIQGPPR